MKEVQIHTETIELGALLKFAGLCQTGGDAKQAIAAGQVLVDGKVETRRKATTRVGQTVQLGTQKITVAKKNS